MEGRICRLCVCHAGEGSHFPRSFGALSFTSEPFPDRFSHLVGIWSSLPQKALLPVAVTVNFFLQRALLSVEVVQGYFTSF